jgi:hypothetical protein
MDVQRLRWPTRTTTTNRRTIGPKHLGSSCRAGFGSCQSRARSQEPFAQQPHHHLLSIASTQRARKLCCIACTSRRRFHQHCRHYHCTCSCSRRQHICHGRCYNLDHHHLCYGYWLYFVRCIATAKKLRAAGAQSSAQCQCGCEPTRFAKEWQETFIARPFVSDSLTWTRVLQLQQQQQ